jgi:hypothetical protein
MKLWEPGQVIVIREIWQNKVYSVTPVRVVQDSMSWSALYLPPQTPCLWPHTREGISMRIPTDEWVLDGGAWTSSDVLYLVQPGSGYTAVAFWDDDFNFNSWKINLEKPMRRTRHGFDYMDQLLDIVVSADRSTWHWRDEDEVSEAQARGIFTAKQANELYQLGERAVQSLLANEPPFDRGWENWKPNPAWRVPLELPSGWEQV